MTATRWGLVALVGLGLVAALVAARELRRQSSPQVEWRTDGGELGRRVRAGAVPGVEHLSFRSASVGEEIGLVVADPHDYDAAAGRTWPVVYFGHGIGGTEWELFEVAPEFVAKLREHAFVVGVNQGRSGGYGPAETMLAVELPALVDRLRRTVATPRGRVLTGFSLGGMTAVYVGLRHQDVFGTVGGFSSACYLIDRCDRIRRSALATSPGPETVVMHVSGTEEDKRVIAFQAELAMALADRPGVEIRLLTGVGHDLASQLAFPLDDGESVGDAWIRALVRQFGLDR